MTTWSTEYSNDSENAQNENDEDLHCYRIDCTNVNNQIVEYAHGFYTMQKQLANG